MENIKERAKELLDGFKLCCDDDFVYNRVIEVMCQLAEEVEKETLKNELEKYSGIEFYTKEEVEELLAKQRKLCVEKAECGYWQHNENFNKESFDENNPDTYEDIWVGGKRIHSDSYKYSTSFDMLPSISISEDSILNAKLEI